METYSQQGKNSEHALTVMMATPELAEYCFESAPKLGHTLLDTVKLCAEATIPAGHRAGFMASVMLYLWENDKLFHDPKRLRFVETDTGDVFWRDI